jgi:hypothetical protein
MNDYDKARTAYAEALESLRDAEIGDCRITLECAKNEAEKAKEALEHERHCDLMNFLEYHLTAILHHLRS